MVECFDAKTNILSSHAPEDMVDAKKKTWLDKELYKRGRGDRSITDQSLEDALDLSTTWVAELDQSAVLQTYVSNFTELSRFPSVRRDIALLINDKINVSEIQQLIEKTGGELLDSTWLFDVYKGQGVEQGKRSLAFALLWQHPTRTLEDAEIKSGMDNIIQVLEDTYQATLRAS